MCTAIMWSTQQNIITTTLSAVQRVPSLISLGADVAPASTAEQQLDILADQDRTLSRTASDLQKQLIAGELVSNENRFTAAPLIISASACREQVQLPQAAAAPRTGASIIAAAAAAVAAASAAARIRRAAASTDW